MCVKSGKYIKLQLYEQIKQISSNQMIRRAADNIKT